MQASRVPPADQDAERALLGAMLMVSATDHLTWDLDEIRAIIGGPHVFTIAEYRTIAKCVFDAEDAREPIEFVSIAPRLDAIEPRADGEWTATCVELAESFADVANAPFYARAVRRAWQKREFIRAALSAMDDAFGPLSEPSDLASSLIGRIERIERASQSDREPEHEADLMQSMANPADDAASKIPVGIGRLQAILGGGFDPGDLVVVGARPSCGKTSLGLGLAVHASKASEGCACLLVSAEMTTAQVLVRLLSMRSRLGVQAIRAGEIDEQQFRVERNRAAQQAHGEAEAGRGLHVLDGVRDVRVIAAAIRRAARHRDVQLAVVDYLGLLDIPGTFDRHDLRIGTMVSIFKALAVDLGICVVVLSQLNRQSANEVRRPRLSDLRDSGEIEQHADTVLLLHRGNDDAGDLCESEIIVAKQRQGDTGTVPVHYRRATMTYESKFLGAELQGTHRG